MLINKVDIRVLFQTTMTHMPENQEIHTMMIILSPLLPLDEELQLLGLILNNHIKPIEIQSIHIMNLEQEDIKLWILDLEDNQLEQHILNDRDIMIKAYDCM